MTKSSVHVVVSSHGIFGAYLDEPGLAERMARAIQGVVVMLPVAKDYRPNSKAEQSGDQQ